MLLAKEFTMKKLPEKQAVTLIFFKRFSSTFNNLEGNEEVLVLFNA